MIPVPAVTGMRAVSGMAAVTGVSIVAVLIVAGRMPVLVVMMRLVVVRRVRVSDPRVVMGVGAVLVGHAGPLGERMSRIYPMGV